MDLILRIADFLWMNNVKVMAGLMGVALALALLLVFVSSKSEGLRKVLKLLLTLTLMASVLVVFGTVKQLNRNQMADTAAVNQQITEMKKTTPTKFAELDGVVYTEGEDGGTYSVPQLKVSKRNWTEDYTLIKSPDGTVWRITVDNDGAVQATKTDLIPASDLPADFPEYTITGASASDEEFLVCVHGETESGYNYIWRMTAAGDVVWYKKVPHYGINFRRLRYADGTIRYSYMICEGNLAGNGGSAIGYLVLMDEDMNVIADEVRPILHGSVTEEYCFSEVHDYRVLGDGHYLLAALTLSTVTNVPGMEGTPVQVVNTVLQEQKDGQVVKHWESIDYPEFYSAAVVNSSYENFIQGQSEKYSDYFHYNCVFPDPSRPGELLLSARSIGVMKLNWETGELLWLMGRGRNDIAGLTEDQTTYTQHDARYQADGSITVYDNAGGPNKEARVCRYYIDEDTKTCTEARIFTTPYASRSMGCAHLVAGETYDIVYGGGVPGFVIEERDFLTDTVNMVMKLRTSQTMYRTFRGEETVPAWCTEQ